MRWWEGGVKRLYFIPVWASKREIDDERVCILCNRVISGRMIDIWQAANGRYRLHCPTPGCPSVPRDWFYHGTSAIAPDANSDSSQGNFDFAT